MTRPSRQKMRPVTPMLLEAQDAALALHLDHHQQRRQAELLERAVDAGRLLLPARDRRRLDGRALDLFGLGRGRLGLLERVGHAQVELLEAERLRQIVVGAEAEALDAILLAAERGQKDHRHERQLGARAQRAHQRPAVELGHHHVGDDEIGPELIGAHQPLFAVAGRGDGVAALLQQRRDHAEDPRVVVHDEDARTRRA